MGKSQRTRGFTLVFALGILSMLVLFAGVLATLARIERRAAGNAWRQLQAEMTAEAGIAWATAELRRRAGERLHDTTDDTWRFNDPLEQDVESAARPSFAAGEVHGYATSGGTNEDHHYTLKVVDCTSRVDVSRMDAATAHIVDVLGAELGLADGLGRKLLDARPPGGYTSRKEIRAALGPEGARLADYLTRHGPQDHQSARRVTREGGVANLELQTRSPINLNTAPREVLVAVLAGLTAQLPDRRITLERGQARAVADALVASRALHAFATWQDVDLALRRAVGIDDDQRALILANGNPNARIQKFNPDAAHRAPIDKSDIVTQYAEGEIIAYRTSPEFCFGSMGRFEIEAVGRLFGQDGTLAEARKETAVEAFSVVRLTSQKDFETFRADEVAATTWPESGDTPPAWTDGQVMLAPLTVGIQEEGLLFAAPEPGDLEPSTAHASLKMADSDKYSYGTKRPSSVFRKGDRFVDGMYLNHLRKRTSIYRSQDDTGALQHVGLKTGSMEFWFKPEGTQPEGGLLFMTQVDPEDATQGVQTIIYYYDGTIRASRTYVSAVQGYQNVFQNQGRVRYTLIKGKLRADARENLLTKGRQKYRQLLTGGFGTFWSFSRDYQQKYLDTWAQAFSDKVLHMASTGQTRAYIRNLEIEYLGGLSHIGCLYYEIRAEEWLPEIFEGGYTRGPEVQRQTTGLLDVIDESNNPERQHDLSCPYALSRSEWRADVPFRPGTWTHVALTWRDGTDMVLLADGEEAYEFDATGPLTPYSSRLRDLTNEVYLGGFSLRRYRDLAEGSAEMAGIPETDKQLVRAFYRLEKPGRTVIFDSGSGALDGFSYGYWLRAYWIPSYLDQMFREVNPSNYPGMPGDTVGRTQFIYDRVRDVEEALARAEGADEEDTIDSFFDGTLDAFRSYGRSLSAGVGGAGFPSPERYRAADGKAVTEDSYIQFRLPETLCDGGGRWGAVAWTEMETGNAALDLAVRVGPSTSWTELDAATQTGRGGRLPRRAGPLDIRAVFKDLGTQVPLRETPVLDDLSVSILGPTRILAETRR